MCLLNTTSHQQPQHTIRRPTQNTTVPATPLHTSLRHVPIPIGSTVTHCHLVTQCYFTVGLSRGIRNVMMTDGRYTWSRTGWPATMHRSHSTGSNTPDPQTLTEADRKSRSPIPDSCLATSVTLWLTHSGSVLSPSWHASWQSILALGLCFPADPVIGFTGVETPVAGDGGTQLVSGSAAAQDLLRLTAGGFIYP